MSHTPFAACSALATMARRDRSCAREHPEQPEAPSVEASPAINLKCYGHAVEGFLDLGETDPASSRWFGVPSESAALQFGRTDAPSTPPLPCPIQPRRLQQGEAHRRSVYRVRITGAHWALDAVGCDRSKIGESQRCFRAAKLHRCRRPPVSN